MTSSEPSRDRPSPAGEPPSGPDSVERTFYNLVKNDPFGVYIVDSDFRLAEVSLGAQKVFANVRPLLGRDFAEVLRLIWPEPFATEAIERFRHTLATGEPYMAPSTVERRKDLQIVEAYDWRIARILLPDGRHGVVCYFYDLSERQRWERALLESEARFREMVDGLPLIVWVHDANGEQELVNQSFREFFGVSREQMKGGRWKVLMHPDDADAYAAEFVACVQDRRPFHATVRVRRADGEWRSIESWARPRFTADGTFRGFVGTSADITDRLAAETALRESDRRKEEFLAILGHELRNPLAPLRTSVELLERSRSPEVIDSAVAMMNRQLAHLMRITEDLLDVSRISRGDVDLRRARIDLNAVVDIAVEQVASLIEDHGHALRIERSSGALPIYGDLERLTQVVGNLLTNAARYSDPEGRIDVRTDLVGSEAMIRVRDVGAGIPPDRLDAIFEMFSQVPEHAARKGGGGLGIGLAIARRIVTMHGGSIHAESEGLGMGSEFVVTLPLARGRRNVESLERNRDGRHRPRRVLIVEDNIDAAESLRRALELRGHVVRVVHDGRAALTTVQEVDPEVVLLDIGLPHMNGYEVARRLRATERGRQLFLVAVTGWGQPEDRARAQSAGFDEHLTKPVHSGELSDLIAAGPDDRGV